MTNFWYHVSLGAVLSWVRPLHAFNVLFVGQQVHACKHAPLLLSNRICRYAAAMTKGKEMIAIAQA